MKTKFSTKFDLFMWVFMAALTTFLFILVGAPIILGLLLCFCAWEGGVHARALGEHWEKRQKDRRLAKRVT